MSALALWCLSDMNTMVNNCSNGVDRPDLILTSQKQFEAFESFDHPSANVP